MIYIKLALTNTLFHSKIKIGNGETTNMVCQLICETHLTVKLQMCFFIGYFCLLIITTNAIIKANAMIVTPINE